MEWSALNCGCFIIALIIKKSCTPTPFETLLRSNPCNVKYNLKYINLKTVFRAIQISSQRSPTLQAQVRRLVMLPLTIFDGTEGEKFPMLN
jgi:hypothetical protein